MIQKIAVAQGKRNEIRLALFSECERYRYALWIEWDSSKRVAGFVGLNPSTATELQDDPTVRRCKGYAEQWGFGGLLMLNAFAYRSTDPRGLLAIDDPVGSDNTPAFLNEQLFRAGIRVAAWGSNARLQGRGDFLGRQLSWLDCLRRNADGSPAHPLYLPKTLVAVPFNYDEGSIRINGSHPNHKA